MQPIESNIEGVQGTFGRFRQLLEPDGFALANWEYQYGFFDKKLDDRGMVFLRLPFEVSQGKLDNDDAWIRFGTPFVLKHVYQTGLDPDIGYGAGPNMSALVNQFQEPEDKDAPLEDVWVEHAREVVRRLEQRMLE